MHLGIRVTKVWKDVNHIDKEAFSAKVTLEEDVAFDVAIAFFIGVGIILLPKFSIVVFPVRLTAYLPLDGAINDHPVI